METKKRKSSLKLPVVLFFIFAAACVIAFLIVILVKSCEAEHEENALIEASENIAFVPIEHASPQWQI